jgi:putative addiction module component (TIGR02574 family)
MTVDVARLLEQALRLPVEARAALVDSLLGSLDDQVDIDAAAAWDAEIGRRLAELDAGAVTSVPWVEVERQIFADDGG